MIKLTNGEVYAWNSLTTNIAEAAAELDRRKAALDAHIALLENKYNAKFDQQAGKFIPINGSKDKEKAKALLKEKEVKSREHQT